MTIGWRFGDGGRGGGLVKGGEDNAGAERRIRTWKQMMVTVREKPTTKTAMMVMMAEVVIGAWLRGKCGEGRGCGDLAEVRYFVRYSTVQYSSRGMKKKRAAAIMHGLRRRNQSIKKVRSTAPSP